MRFLLDTNLLSETLNRYPDTGVVAWMAEQAVDDLAVSVLSIGELERGILKREPDPRRDKLRAWLDETMPATYGGRIIPVDEPIARRWGQVWADAKDTGRPIPDIDGLLVATALVHDLTLVTRNERHCAGRGAPHINPWSGESIK